MPDGATVVVMPKLSDAMEDGTIVTWLIGDGIPVTRGQDLLEIETDKAIAIYQSPADGILHRVVSEGDTIGVGEPIAELRGSAPESKAPGSQAGPTITRAAAAGPTVASTGDGTRVMASPLARRKARATGVDLRLVAGSGRGGRILSSDVDVHLEQTARNQGAALPGASADVRAADSAASEQDTKRTPFNRSQMLVARRMTEAHNTIPDFQAAVEIDMAECVRLRASLNELERPGPAPSFNDLVIRACALALKQHPRLNSYYAGDAVERHDAVHIGMAVAVDDRLLVPTIRDADSRDLLEIATESKRLVTRARDGSITPGELDGATFTVSNLGMLAVDDFTAVITPPQVGILAVGVVAERPVVRDGLITVRSIMRATLSADHRVVYGADAGRFLASLRRLLENPIALLLNSD